MFKKKEKKKEKNHQKNLNQHEEEAKAEQFWGHAIT